MVKITDPEYGFEEEKEEAALGTEVNTNFPQPLRFTDNGKALWDSRSDLRWKLIYEIYNQSIEDLYFRALDYLREEEGFAQFDKIVDLFAASAHSAFFGVAQQRLGLQQDKISQFLATIGKMVKELFQLVREIRIIDERLFIYNMTTKKDKAAEISLKGYWIDLVEGGAKNPASVLGLSREVGFATLPDLFFDAPPMEPEEVQKHVDALQFNRKVKEVLSRKLQSFVVWKMHTHKELQHRRLFTVKYLRQHYDVIKMYMNWVKPYLKHIKRLTLDEKKAESEHLISAFEGSLIEIEVLAKKPMKEEVYAVYNLHFDYRSRPEMKFVQEGYQRGPQHCGRTTFTLRGYAWSEEEIKKYKEFKSKEDFELLSDVDESVKAAYTALGEELEKYLKQAGESTEKDFNIADFKDKEKMPGFFDPFLAPFKSVGGRPAGKPRCPSCGTENDKINLYCSNCKRRMRKPTSDEAFKEKNARGAAKKYCMEHWRSFIKRYKSPYGFIW